MTILGPKPTKSITIIGGGIAGLILSIQLARKGVKVTVIEKDDYPKHKVCGEYISNEVVPFLRSINCYPEKFSPPQIQKFQLSSTKGRSANLTLDLGGFGISRHAMDFFLYQIASTHGVSFLLNTRVDDVKQNGDKFFLDVAGDIVEADVVVGAHGKKSKLDSTLTRQFVGKRSPYVAVKYHIKTDFPSDLIALHNFKGGYCGISRVENDVVNLCYLSAREELRKAGSIDRLEEIVLSENPLLRYILANSDKIFDKPLVINEVSFLPKGPIENGILMTGDSAGMIAPLCGNGMAIAIHSSKILGDCLIRYCTTPSFTRDELNATYADEWRKEFLGRLRRGRWLQHLFGNHLVSEFAVQLALSLKPFANAMVKSSHGKPF